MTAQSHGNHIDGGKKKIMKISHAYLTATEYQ